MKTFLVERVIPARLNTESAEDVALHCRWAVDAYRQVGAVWLGGVVTHDRLLSLVVAEQQHDIERYCELLGISPEHVRIEAVIRPLGPFLAAPVSPAA